MQKVSFEGRNLAYNVPRLLLECAYPIQDASTVLSGQRARVGLCLRPPLPASHRPGRTRGLHELLVVAAKRIALAVLVPVDAHALAAWRVQGSAGRAAAQLALERSRPRLRRWAGGTGGRDSRAGTNICGWRARPLAELMLRGTRLGYLRVRLGRTGRHVLARLGHV